MNVDPSTVDPSTTEADHIRGRAIKKRRIDLDLDQDELAARAGVSKGYLSKIERGKKAPSIGVLSRIATVLGTRPGVLEEAPTDSGDVSRRIDQLQKRIEQLEQALREATEEADRHAEPKSSSKAG